jgi:hypothetical protein
MQKKKIILIVFCMKGGPFAYLKGNNSCEMYNFRIKVGNVQMFYSLNCLTCVMVHMMASNMVVCELKPLLGQTERLWNWYLLLLH